mmetsp:Transcript_32620/g.49883  ORF Transcript_32620/g.49883 Transcript_32620/m.49883 type:complete len:82 (-) Transcript_32620:3339-3584(-)
MGECFQASYFSLSEILELGLVSLGVLHHGGEVAVGTSHHLFGALLVLNRLPLLEHQEEVLLLLLFTLNLVDQAALEGMLGP